MSRLLYSTKISFSSPADETFFRRAINLAVCAHVRDGCTKKWGAREGNVGGQAVRGEERKNKKETAT